jgi:hypothetical protein
MKKENKQTIKCDVSSCKYLSDEKELCELGEIKVSNCKDKAEKEATMCDSYKAKKDE